MLKKIFACLLILLCAAASLPAYAESDNARNWYEIFVRSYKDSDGDGIGDLQGVIEKLDYVEYMGYDGLWLMPVMPSPSYHKYDVTDYKAIDPQYGSMADMRALVNACHERGIKIIIDMVLNHSSVQHPWFIAACDALRAGDMSSPYIDYYCFTQKSAQKYVPVSGTDWAYEEQFEGGGMPDLNLDSEALWNEIRDIFSFWLQDVGVDGFRLDAVTSYYANNTPKNVEALAKVNALAEEMKPGCYLIGEAWTGLNEIARYYESGVDSFFLFPVSQAEGSIARVIRARSKNAQNYMSELCKIYDAIPDGLLAPFLGNHDTGRAIASLQARQNPERAKFAEGILNMIGGATFTYYGEEIGMVGAGDDPNKRLAMYWSDGDMTSQPPGVTKLEYAYPSVEAQLADDNSLLHYCRQLNWLKKENPAIARGENEFVSCEDDVLIMKRTWEGETCCVAINFSAKQEKTAALTLSNPFIAGQINVSADMANLSDTQNGPVLSIPAYGIVVLCEKKNITGKI